MTLQVTNLECYRGERLLFVDLSFTLQAGEILFIRGANGAGKTSLLRVLAGLAKPTAGSVHHQETIAYLGHKNGIKANLTVLENLQLATVSAAPIHKEFLPALLTAFNLYNFCNHLAYQLSAGQKQRVALIRLLASTAKLWLMDEPLTALDTAAIEKLRLYLQQHLRNGGMAIMTSHQPFLVENSKIIELVSQE